MGPRAWIILQSMTGSFFSLWPQLSTKRLFFPPGCGVSSFPWEGLCLLALSLPGCDESCNLSPGVMRLGFGASFIGMWCPHMPRQLRLLLPAACAKELAPPSQPASTSPRLFLILFSAAFQAQWDTWPGGANTVWLDSLFLGDDFGLSMSK